MPRKKIAVLTFFRSANPGAFLQLYALAKVLERKGFGVEVVRYRSSFLLNEFRSRFHRFKGLSRLTRLGEVAAFMRFYSRQFKVRRIQRSSFWSRYHAVVFGSDEIWNFKNWFSGYCPILFGKDVAVSRKIAYAPSFGDIDDRSEMPPELPALLGDFHSISVRDHNSQAIVRRLTGREPPICLDPTLLFEFEPRNVGTFERPLLLVYATHVSSRDRASILEYARRHGLAASALGFHQPWINSGASAAHPLDVLALFERAGAVYTNTFHGLVFALKFNRPVLLGDIAGKEQKISSLCTCLGLHLANSDSPPATWFADVPMSEESQIRLKALQQASFDFLSGALTFPLGQ